MWILYVNENDWNVNLGGFYIKQQQSTCLSYHNTHTKHVCFHASNEILCQDMPFYNEPMKLHQTTVKICTLAD